jgi:hypothetical protein
VAATLCFDRGVLLFDESTIDPRHDDRTMHARLIYDGVTGEQHDAARGGHSADVPLRPLRCHNAAAPVTDVAR